MNAETDEDGLAEDQAALAVEVFRMLADVTRLQLLWALLDDELAVNQLAATVGRAQSAVSQHLAKLRMAGLVQSRRDGTKIFYRVESDHIRQLVRDALFHAEHAADGVPRHHRRSTEHATVTSMPQPDRRTTR